MLHFYSHLISFLPLASVHSSRAWCGRHKVIPLSQGWPLKLRQKRRKSNKKLGKRFLHICKTPIHNTSCHTRKCDTSKVMNSATVTLLALGNKALILNGWVNASPLIQISPILFNCIGREKIKSLSDCISF